MILGLENTFSAEDNARMLDRAQLETVTPSVDVRQDMKTNLDYIRGLLAQH